MCLAQAPRVPVPLLAQVLPAGGDLIQVGQLVRRVHVAGVRLQRHGQGVMVSRDAAQVAADERHRRAAVTLAVQVQEVGHDQPEHLQVPLQRRAEPGGAQHHVAQPLDLGRPPGRPLGGVDAGRPGPEVQRQRGTPGQRGQVRDAVHHPHRVPAGVTQPDGVPAPVRGDRPVHAAGQPVQVVPGGGLEGRPDEPGARAAADHQARRARLTAAQQQRLGGPVGHGEAEVGAEPLGPVQVRLLELQPRQPGHLDQRIPRPPRMLPAQSPGLAVQRAMRVLPRSILRRGPGRVQVCRHDRFPHSQVLIDPITFVANYQL